MKNAPCVNVYETGRAFGGPEEGGWWYDTREPIASYPIRGALKSDKARRQLNTIRAKYGFKSSRSKLYQMRNDYDCLLYKRKEYAGKCWSEVRNSFGRSGILVCLEYGPAKASPDTKPHYE